MVLGPASALLGHRLMYRRVLWLLVIVAELARRRHEAAKVVVAAVLLLEAPARDIDASGLASVGLGDVG